MPMAMMGIPATRASSRTRDVGSWVRRGLDDTEIWIVLTTAMVLSATLVLWLNRDLTFSVDELSWFSTSPHLTFRDAIEPYNGHLVATSRLVYAAIFDVFGASYLPFRLLVAGSVVLLSGLIFVFAKLRIGAVTALAPSLVLLFYGSGSVHVLSGNGFTILLALAAGVAALLVIEREDLAGDLGACALLCLAVATYSVGLPFIAGIAVLVLTGANRWRRAWIFVIPAVLYGAWFLWSRNAGASAESHVTLTNLLVVPAWGLESVATNGAALLGLDYDFVTGTPDPAQLHTGWGPVVAVIALIALGWRVWRVRISKRLWAMLAVAAALWLIQAAAVLREVSSPYSTRYIFPGTIVILLVAVEAARGTRLGRKGTIVLYGLTALSLATNIALLRDTATNLRATSAVKRADLTAIELSGGQLSGLKTLLLGGALEATGQGGLATGYLEAERSYGSPAFTLPELRAQSEAVRSGVDQTLARGLGLRLKPAPGPARDCRRIPSEPRQDARFALRPGETVLNTSGEPGPLRLRRFGSAFSVVAGTLTPGVPMALTVPSDSAPDPWYASTSATPLSICAPPD
jgi:hypothetical protein